MHVVLVSSGVSGVPGVHSACGMVQYQCLMCACNAVGV